MIPVMSLITILVLSVLITRISTIALMHTGLSLETARFQARSAFTGAGFTTSESERIVAHPVRRKIVMVLMMIGNAGLVTAVASLMLTFVGDESSLTAITRIALLAAGVSILWALAMSRWVEQQLANGIEWALKRYTKLDVQDYAALMHIADDYRVAELKLSADDWLAGKTLRSSGLREEGLLVLGIERTDGQYLGAPKPDTKVLADDRLLIYGRSRNLESIDNRKQSQQGDHEHQQAVVAHRSSNEHSSNRHRYLSES